MTEIEQDLPDRLFVTPGVMAMAEYCRAGWLLRKIADSQDREEVAREEFQVWKFLPGKNGGHSRLVCEDGNKNAVYRCLCNITDFPAPDGVTLYFENNTLCLPDER